jgi:amidase
VTGPALGSLDACAQAALVRSGEVRPDELVSAAVTRAEELDPRLGLLVSSSYDRALDAARSAAPGAPFAGVPIILKDLHCHQAGDLLGFGCRGLLAAGVRASFTTRLAGRLAEAGFASLGRGTTSEFGLLPTTEARTGPPTRNPWAPDRSAGGSSGGSAAAVAAGVVPVAHGNDGGGSLRIPAAACGVVGLKPSRGRTSLGPGTGEAPGGVLCEHVLTRSVRDSALVLDVVSGPAPGDPYTALPPEQQSWYSAAVAGSVAGLRIGVATGLPAGVPVDPGTAGAVQDAAAELAAGGARVEESHPDALDGEDWRPRQLVLYVSRAAHALEHAGELRGRPLAEDEVEGFTWAMSRMGAETSAPALLAALQFLGAWTHRLLRWWQPEDGMAGHDLLLCPVLPGPPPPLGTVAPDGADPWAVLLAAAELTRFTGFANLSGQPAISVPLGRDGRGLPRSVQLVAAHGREDLLLAAAAALERHWPAETAMSVRSHFVTR